MSSSIASQCIPLPWPINLQRLRSSRVAASRRGNQARGTDTVRPSSSVTVSASSEHETSTANASELSTASVYREQQKAFGPGTSHNLLPLRKPRILAGQPNSAREIGVRLVEDSPAKRVDSRQNQQRSITSRVLLRQMGDVWYDFRQSDRLRDEAQALTMTFAPSHELNGTWSKWFGCCGRS